jgi:hypothetical protein
VCSPSRAPRRKRLADRNNYHKAQEFGLPEKIRIPTELLESWCKILHHLGKLNADVLRWLFTNSKSQIGDLPSTPLLPSTPMPSPRLETSEQPNLPLVVQRHEDAGERLSDLDDDLDAMYATSTDPSSGDDVISWGFESQEHEDEDEDDFPLPADVEQPTILARYAFVSREKLANLFTTFQVKCPQPECS